MKNDLFIYLIRRYKINVLMYNCIKTFQCNLRKVVVPVSKYISNTLLYFVQHVSET